MGRLKKKISVDMGDFIQNHTEMTVKELSQHLRVKPSKIYYYIKKNNIEVKSKKSGVKDFLNTL